MKIARCWRCDHKLFEISAGATGEITIRCPKCKADQRVALDTPVSPVLRFAVTTA